MSERPLFLDTSIMMINQYERNDCHSMRQATTHQTQFGALKFLSFEGATIQTRNEATDWFVCGAVNHSAGSFGERSSCCFARNMSRDFSVPKQPSKQWFYGWCSLRYEARSGASVPGCHHYRLPFGIFSVKRLMASSVCACSEMLPALHCHKTVAMKTPMSVSDTGQSLHWELGQFYMCPPESAQQPFSIGSGTEMKHRNLRCISVRVG